MLSSIISKYLEWQRKVCESVSAAVEHVTGHEKEPVRPTDSPANAAPEKAAEPANAPAAPKKADAPMKASDAKQKATGRLDNGGRSVEAKADRAETSKKAVHEMPEAEAQPEIHEEPKPMNGWQMPPAVRENPSDIVFQDFPLDLRIQRAILEDLKFTKCTPIQGLTLPHALAGADIAGKAQTGTGKTATFLISMLQRFLTDKQDSRAPNQPFALALAPTRELAIQIAHDANSLCAYCHFKTVAVYGGMDYERQRRMLNSNVDLVVATPGRLIDFLQQHVLNLDAVQVLIIDEADRMLDMGFIPDVKRIVSRLKGPETRQTMLFSATLNNDIMNLAARWMRPNPVKMEVEPEHVVAEGIDETVYALRAEEKLPALLWTLSHEDCRRVLIFRNRRSEVEELHEELKRYGVASEMLSGDVDQKKRLRILEDFKAGKIQVIVATDVAGRGIHVDDVTHVINYDFPYEAEDYVHRVGRTARAGHRGRAISFADEYSSFVIPDIEKFIARPLPITQPTDEMLKLPKEFKNVRPRVEKPHSMKMRNDRSNSSYRGARVRRGGPRR